MKRRVLYLGDGTLRGAARYLAGVLSHYRIPFDHIPTDRPLSGKKLRRGYGLFILSDYPSRNLSFLFQRQIVREVAEGAALLMIGGWSSFEGLDGCYKGTPIGNILPVVLSAKDDRLNSEGGVIVYPKGGVPFLKGISFRRSPVIAGLNRLSAKREAEVFLWAREIVPQYPRMSLGRKEYPLLVVGTYRGGKVAALATDVAPHWVGSFVDWGKTRVSLRVKRGVEAEVGDKYLRLLGNLIKTLLQGLL